MMVLECDYEHMKMAGWRLWSPNGGLFMMRCGFNEFIFGTAFTADF
jgi:hypothetical protein